MNYKDQTLNSRLPAAESLNSFRMSDFVSRTINCVALVILSVFLLSGSMVTVLPNAFGDFQAPVPSECATPAGPPPDSDHTLTASLVESTISGNATISSPGLYQVRFVLDPGVGSSQQLDTSSPFTYSFASVSPGSHTVVACFEIAGIVSFVTLHTQARTLTVAPIVDDLTITEVTVVQGIEVKDREVDSSGFLIKAKKSLLKVTTESSFSNNISTKIQIDQCRPGGISVLCLPPIIEDITVKPGSNTRFLPESSFIYPDQIGPVIFPSQAGYAVRVTLDPHGTILESNEDNNSKSASFNLKETRVLKILFVPLEIKDGGATAPAPDSSQMSNFANNSSEYLLGVYPLSDTGLSTTISPYPYTPNVCVLFGGIFGGIPGICNKSEPVKGPLTEQELAQIFEKLDTMARRSNVDQVVGVVRPGWFDTQTPSKFKDLAGLSTYCTVSVQTAGQICYTRASIIESDEISGTVAAHEISHNHGWVNVSPPGDTSGVCPEVLILDPSPRLVELPCHMSNVDAPGYWVDKKCDLGIVTNHKYNLVSDICSSASNTPIDFMDVTTPSREEWISNFTWDYLAQSLAVRDVDNCPPGYNKVLCPSIIIRGLIDDEVVLDPWYLMKPAVSLPGPEIPLNNPGSFQLVYLNKLGTEIGRTGFTPSAVIGHGKIMAHTDALIFSSETTSNPMPFSLAVPALNDTSRMLIEYNGTVLAERIVTPNPPNVHLTTPNGGEMFRHGDVINVRWDAFDSDIEGEPLTYTVLISEDLGATWVSLDFDFAEQEFSFVAPPNVLTSSALIKVIASDGVNTGEDVSDLPFTIAQADGTPPVGGEILGVDMSSLLIAGAAASAGWIIPAAGAVAAAGIVGFVLSKRIRK